MGADGQVGQFATTRARERLPVPPVLIDAVARPDVQDAVFAYLRITDPRLQGAALTMLRSLAGV
ncbi:hypothetical protein JIP62_05625 [Brevundimonas vitis]|jgi:hypothetical protein|uniref:Uncharacterized protein n=1 Tax=Brevundimonas vitisensis TaxID=2800818 RepID=A0ABX7BQ41_9CAUL|nr:hypothetical protein [Brevundimonas vitisensis]QQQ19570.1 hypothetical protein JIP62_05625 [Brevundimonas vitisensis]